MTAKNTELVKKKALRHSECYNLQQTFDELFALGKRNKKLTDIIDALSMKKLNKLRVLAGNDVINSY
jgi:hypothetical protein